MRFSGGGVIIIVVIVFHCNNNVLGAVQMCGGDMAFSTTRFPSEVIPSQARTKRELIHNKTQIGLLSVLVLKPFGKHYKRYQNLKLELQTCGYALRHCSTV